jgi:hypothetical protein
LKKNIPEELNKIKYTSLLLVLLLLLNCQTHTRSSHDGLIDIKTTAEGLTLLGINIISTSLYERDFAVSPQSDEVIYTLGDYKQEKRNLVYLKRVQGKWTSPQILNISGEYQDIEPFYTKQGDRLYFASNRPIYGDASRKDYNIWYSDRTQTGWSKPVALDSIINTRGDEFFPSLSDAGNLFFTATKDNGMGKEDIFKSEWIAGKFQTPKALPKEINTASYEFNAYVSPDENLIIFSSFGRSDGFGGGDLYISRKDSLGKWSASKNLGAIINSDRLDYCPFVDWKSGNFYFTSERKINEPKKIENIEALKAFAHRTQNGFGNIYKIGVDQLE